MIKYLELTAPESNEFRQAKIISIEVSEGDTVEIGDTLFRVKSGNKEIDLPSTRAGKVCELIVLDGENISVMTPLLLLETEVSHSTATPPITSDLESSEQKNETLESEQSGNNVTEVKQSINKKKTKKKKKKNKKAKPKKSTQTAINNTDREQAAEKHQQQSLDLAGDQSQSMSIDFAQSQKSEEQPILDIGKPTNPKAENTMSSNTQITKISVPDIGGDAAKVIELHVKVGDHIEIEESLITLESDKASMDVPSTMSGIVISIAAQVDQELNEGDLILEIETANVQAQPLPDNADQQQESPSSSIPDSSSNSPENETHSPDLMEIAIPDIGGDSAKVIEILVTVGQSVNKEDPIVTLESDKASMEVPSSSEGIVESIEVNLDQEVSEGVVIVKLRASESNSLKKPDIASVSPTPKANSEIIQANTASESVQPSAIAPAAAKSHASPSIRRFARELGVDLSQVAGSGRKGRISKGDVKSFVKGIITGESKRNSDTGAAAGGSAIPEIPSIDFSKFGDIEIQPLNRIKRLTATNLHRSWLNVPHVTHHDESNINDLEEFRKQLNQEYSKQNKGIKLSPLAFIVKAVVNALQTYPQFNSSLEPGGENLILKKYFNIGIAVETPNGLVVPVLKDADKMSVAEIATQMGELAAKARDKKLTTKDMTGAGFTISSLGGIGGTSFTPIVNAPEVAILGVSRSKVQPIWDGAKFEPGIMLPLSLSYDHRVIDGAEAARFTRQIAAVLEDVRRLAL